MKDHEIDTLIDLIAEVVQDLRGYQAEIRDLEGQRLKLRLKERPLQAVAHQQLIRDLETRIAHVGQDVYIAFRDIQRYVNHGDRLFSGETDGQD